MEQITIRDYGPWRETEILPLYASVGWSNYVNSPEMLRRAFEGSLCILGAYEGERLVGLARAVGDGSSILFLQDLLIRPEYQRRGIGRSLVEALLERYPQVYQVQLATDRTPKNLAFYRALGFRSYEELGYCGFMKG